MVGNSEKLKDENPLDDRGLIEDIRVGFSSTLARRYLYPPFSILDARHGEWMTRKKQWKRLGIQGELGRRIGDDDDLGSTYAKSLDRHGHKTREEYAIKAIEKSLGRTFNIRCDDYRKKDDTSTQTSIFDPVLTELMYKWFCPEGGTILDPFAGVSTRGVVAEVLGYHYVGIELRQFQIDANRKQSDKIDVHPTWVNGDSIELDKLLPDDEQFDFLFTCPPYFDLEIYSREFQTDGSAFDNYDKFVDWYYRIFEQAVRKLKKNRFCIVVVGEIRDKKTGSYRNLVGDTVAVFTELGIHYYNEMILITMGGSLSLRITKQFEASRKIGKTHQNVLVFWKGDLTKIKSVFKKGK